jgi:NitT/TauT family transport system permease protein
VGIGIGMAMGAYRKVEMALDFYVYALLTAPSLVFAPLFFPVFGASNSRLSVLGIIVMYAIFIVIVNTTSAIRNVPAPLIEMGRAYCASERQLFFKIILPAATPLIMAGLRLAMGRAVKGMINGEMFIAIVGLGEVVTSAGDRFDAEGVLAVLLVIITVAMVAVKAVQLVDQRLTGWLPSTARQRRRNA